MSEGKRAARRLLNAQLQRNEWVLWSGRPEPLRYALRESPALLLGVLSLILLLLIPDFDPGLEAIYIALLGIRVHWMIVFFAAVALLGIAQPIYFYWVATQTIYAVTDRRALSIKPTRKGRVIQSYTNIEKIERRDLANGTGDLIFGYERHIVRSMRYGTRVHLRGIGFIGIHDVARVEQLMQSKLASKQSAESL